ncbi:MAG: hypothetical protein IJC27_00510 [Lentisphaeria bacterium]|nr:hypothetical protein [Lentisphaeria bacterium]
MKKFLLTVILFVGAVFSAAAENPTPEFLKDVPENKVVKFGPERLRLNNSAKFVREDADSETGKSLAAPAPNEKWQHGIDKKPRGAMYSSTVSIYNWTAKKQGPSFTIREFPQDEKFHWYKLWDYEFLPGRTSLLMWWWQMQADLSKVYKADAGNKYTVYVSLKFTGPAYVPGSQKQDGVFIDQVILVKITD